MTKISPKRKEEREDSYLLSSIITIADYRRDEKKIKEIATRAQEAKVQAIFVFDYQDREMSQFQSYCAESHLEHSLLSSRAGNPGGSRNMGMRHAVGKWIHFCDSDDLPDYSQMVHELRNSRTSLLGYSALVFPSLSRRGEIERIMTPTRCHIFRYPGLWRWLFDSETALNTSFPCSRMGEDQAFIIDFLGKIERIRFIEDSQPIYIHFEGVQGSLTSNFKARELKIAVEYAVQSLVGKRSTSFFNLRLGLVLKMIMVLFWRGNYVEKVECTKMFLKIVRRLIYFSK